MLNIQKLNSISPVYQGILPETEYNVAYEVENPDAIMVRSASMHGMDINDNLLCVGRAGAGVNNIPLEKMAEQGVVVFNSPGANANAVKELVLAGLLLSSRKIADGIQWCKGLTPGEQTVEKQVEAGKKQFVGPELDAEFVAEAARAGMVNLKGHRVVGGIRASIYNAMPIEGVRKLAAFMMQFESENK